MGAPTLRVIDSQLPEPPYPKTTKAGSFSFSIEYDRLQASDTWVLVPSDVRPWCLMSWVVSWGQVPCGSLPGSDEAIAARLGCDIRFFSVHRDEIMRGWVLHSDGRYYHPVVTERVLDFLATREKWATKKQAHRSNVSGDSPGSPRSVSGVSPPSFSFSSSFKQEKEKGGRFAPPAPQDVEAYCSEAGITLDPQVFVDFYASKNWMVGKSKMKDWKAAARNWARRDRQDKAQESSSLPRADEELERWASKHGYPAPSPGMTYRQYRQYLQAQVDKRG